MKRCSQCNQTYPDDDLNYCLSDGTPLVFVSDSSSQPTVMIPSPFVRQPVQSVRQGVNSLFVYLAIGLLALVVGGMAMAWLKSDSNASSITKSEPPTAISNSTEQKPNTEQKQLDEQKESLAQEQERLERERQKLADERKKLESKKNESSVASTTTSSTTKSSSGTWFVVLGSFSKNEQWKADERLQTVRNSGYDASIVDTNNYPGFRSGLLAVVMGPYSKSDARGLLARMKSVRSDAYIKSGW